LSRWKIWYCKGEGIRFVNVCDMMVRGKYCITRRTVIFNIMETLNLVPENIDPL